MKRFVVLLLLGFLVGTFQCQGIFGNDWIKGIFDNINRMNSDIQRNVQRINHDIQESVRNRLTMVESFNKDAKQKIDQVRMQAITQSNNGPMILVNGAGGTSRTVLSGTSSDGQPYFLDIEDRIIGDMLHRTERVYNAVKRTMDEHRYTLNLKDPNAKPVLVQA